MIETSKLRAIGVLSALALAGCSLTSGGEIPCVEDASCPNDFPVCGPAGKCIAGTSTGNVTVAIVGAAGKQAGDPVRGTVSIQVAARSTSGVKSVSLAGGGKTFTPATGAAGPVYDITVDTTTLADGSVSFTATVTPGDASAQPVSSTAFALTVDNTAPVLSSAATIAPVALGSLVTLDVTATEALGTLSADVLLLGDVIGHGTELSAPTGNVHHLGFAVVNSATPATYSFSVTATDLAGNPTAVAFTKPFTVAPNPTSDVTVDLANVTNGDAVKVTTGFTGGTAVISALPAGTETLPASPAAGQQITLHPAADTVYTLSVTNAAGVTALSTVKVSVAQSVSVSLAGPSSAISPGDSINLVANVGGNAKQVIIDPGNLTVTADGLNHSIPVSPSATTTYSLIATNGAGREYRTTTTITVSQPQILSFTGPDVVTSNAGGIVLTAQFSPYSTTSGAPSATAAIAVPGAPGTFCTPGIVTGTGTGTQSFGCPAITADTSYTLDLALGTSVIHANVAVQGAPAPSVEVFAATPPVLPFSPLPSPLVSGKIGLISQFCATANPPLPPAFRCSATQAANGGTPLPQPHSGTPPTATQIPAPSVTTTYTLLVSNTAGATGSAQVTVPNYQGTIATNAMGSAHIGGIASLLPSGKVLAAGGSSSTSATNAVDYAELFDPSTGSWSAVQCSCAGTSSCGGSGSPQATLQAKRFQAAAATLSNGRVLISGGANSGSAALTTVEVYDPAEDCFRANATDLNTARAAHSATPYANKAVIIGGNALKSCEVYTPGSESNNGTFASCSGTNKDMQLARANHVAILLSSRYVLVAGGGPSGDRSADIYDSASDGTSGFTALSTTVMQVARTSATATLLSNGKVLIAGGGSATAELFTFTAGTPPSGTTAATSNSMGVSRTGHAAIALNGGAVLMAGGNASSAVDAYDPVANSFGTTFSLGTSRPDASIGFPLLLDGRAIVGGGTTAATAADYIIP
ncbi:MAG: hypothetical protein AUH38_05530 [Deltaproteobacteria bacterium 13_1_40CM_68_24]|nr:MAG: hypothetical protein AUH38_05530 [Deltaproteobacteria bacterium 13_1_40CM_68_24]OLC77442.1 MAG: hypothetical protein AUH83_04610 [Deltaproteobacteria bacterium 13_1_40CM_4_68_19]